jgi:hypothetical protein
MKALITIGVVAALGFAGFGLYSKYSSLQQTGADWETQLNAQYVSNQNELSTYISKFYEEVGIANLKSDKMDQILSDAVKGRYDGKMSSAQVGQGSMFSAIKEAYPNIDMSQYDRIMDLISSGRDAYKDKQNKLIDMLRGFDKWRISGPLQKMFIGWMGLPDNELVARIGQNKPMRGQDAEDAMWTIVTTKSTQDAYQTGTMDPLAIPGASPAPAKKQ